jgi:endonuclease/exonuclease/phosphatase family metal-dependent hydrolase
MIFNKKAQLNCLSGLLLWILVSSVALSQPVNLITFNIRYDNPNDLENNWNYRKENIVRLILHYDASIVGTQEGLNHQVEFLDSCLVNYACTGVGRDDGQRKGEYCAIFYNTTRFKLVRGSTFWLSETPGQVSVGWDAALERICTYGLFEDRSTFKRIWIFNTHFDHRGPQARAKAASLILEQIEQINDDKLPVVLMGDFNTTPEEKPIQILKTGLADALGISAKPLYGPAGTFNGFTDEVMDKRIDYFFLSGLDVLSYTHIDDRRDNNRHISDHLPVMITAIYNPSHRKNFNNKR